MFRILARSGMAAILFAAGFSLGIARTTAEAQSQPSTGPIRLAVDASQAPQKILHIHMQIPVSSGPLTLYYPEWIPGEHMPDGPLIQVTGLRFKAGDKTIAWRRDLVEMFSIHLEIPQEVSSLEADFDFLLSAPATGFSAGASATASLEVLSWNQVLLYPAGTSIGDVIFVPSLRLPSGWKFGTALPGAKRDGDTIEFAPVSLDMLVDSPVIAGKYFRAIQLTPGQDISHEMDIAADSAAALAMPPDMEAHYHQLVDETGVLFGPRHYRGYHFLVTLSDDVAHFGLEHHESSDDRAAERSLIDDTERIGFAGLLPHEFVHSWNGKFRRPAGLATPDYQQPMKDDLLWVYEGLTEYLGEVLSARSGLVNTAQSHEALALLAANYDHRPGRDWRPLQDTADGAPFLYNAGADWANWRRGTDFYEEGELLWLDVDATLRRLTGDKKSLNDFCHAFHGGPGGQPDLKTYTFDDVVATLNGIAAYDWAGFLRAHLDGTSTKTPLEAVEASGWRVVYNEEPNEIQENQGAVGKFRDESLTVGVSVGDDGTVIDVIHGGPAYASGIGPGTKIVAVNGQQYTSEALAEAIDAGKTSTAPMQWIVASGADYRTYSVDYHGGPRYPHLERDERKPDYLSEILHPLAAWIVK